MKQFKFSAEDAFGEPCTWNIEVDIEGGQTMVKPLIEQEPLLMAMIETMGNTEFVSSEHQLLDIMHEAEQFEKDSIYPLTIGELKMDEADGGYVFTDLSGKPLPVERLITIFNSIPGMEEVH